MLFCSIVHDVLWSSQTDETAVELESPRAIVPETTSRLLDTRMELTPVAPTRPLPPTREMIIYEFPHSKREIENFGISARGTATRMKLPMPG